MVWSRDLWIDLWNITILLKMDWQHPPDKIFVTWRWKKSYLAGTFLYGPVCTQSLHLLWPLTLILASLRLWGPGISGIFGHDIFWGGLHPTIMFPIFFQTLALQKWILFDRIYWLGLHSTNTTSKHFKFSLRRRCEKDKAVNFTN